MDRGPLRTVIVTGRTADRTSELTRAWGVGDHPPWSPRRADAMAFTLKPLPFPKDSLGPTMSARTLEHHHDKHHATYVKKLNELTEGTTFESMSLEAIIKATAGSAEAKQKKIFNNAAQVWNHDFFWESLAPNGGGTPPEPVLKRIESAFTSFENFRDKFVAAAVDQFGSGWAWLVLKNGKLEITTTHDADNPLTSDTHALWTCDVWEHAYYLDYQQDRANFVKAVIENAANWQFVGKRLSENDK
jgi:Fe-Mn family superoxide dismutase